MTESGSKRSSVQLDLDGNVALITGGGSGMGRAIALGLATAGIDVAIADIVLKRVESTLEEMHHLPNKKYGLVADVSRADEVERLVAGVSSELGPIDILIHCAGIFPRSTVIEMEEEQWDQVLGVNLKSMFLLSRAILPMMIEYGRGKILTLTSDLGTSGIPRGSHYAASKAALNAFTRSLSAEVAASGIRVNAIAPGLTDTPLMRGAQTSEYIASVVETMPDHRLPAPEHVVGMVYYLLSDAAKHISGQVITMRS